MWLPEHLRRPEQYLQLENRKQRGNPPSPPNNWAHRFEGLPYDLCEKQFDHEVQSNQLFQIPILKNTVNKNDPTRDEAMPAHPHSLNDLLLETTDPEAVLKMKMILFF